MEDKLLELGAAIFISYYVIKELFGIIKSKKFNSNGISPKEIRDKLETKRSKENCRSFRTRIGKESEEHRTNISDMKNVLSEIKENVGFIRGKMSQN